jgi:hypothetical protein
MRRRGATSARWRFADYAILETIQSFIEWFAG